jgi:TatD DNase family protein
MSKFINIHTHKTGTNGIAIINAPAHGDWPSGKLYSWGLHPWNIGELDEETEINKLKNLCKEKKIAAVGEIGLDRVINIPLEKQNEVFIKQLEIAEKYFLPVILHSVKTNSCLLSIRKKRENAGIWIFHGFRGSLQEAVQLINNKCYLSFGNAIVDNQKNQDVLKQIPLENVFFETDDSDVKVESIYKKASEILQICIDDLKTKIYSNFIKVFKETCKKIG